MHVLIADDEPHMLNILEAYFSREGFTVSTAQDGEEALEQFYAQSFDLAVLDWMMPRKSGVQVCKEIKPYGMKVLLLTAKGEAEDELAALEAGADDYVRKPFDPRVLLIRAKKLLQMENDVWIGPLRVDMAGQKIYKNDVDIQATNREFQLMKCLIQNRGRIMTRKALLDHGWGFDYEGEERTVDTHIRRLREKIGDDLIKTHRGIGYSLEEQHE
ncbi:response regulator transcription factor [Paenibacillus sp. 1001270B_150601_E10]|uniref:response regulator transcription factor n=1 Tax=Paenibacillus sp. 1001270B_150601_E10 TaxID=2787079 RepID=UPI0018A0B2AB|nr:response regulator transcription factor [Paenibacillus sp. 1001270B_150601_E10]